ncbi:hypothetical protein WA026_008212 [Henosepilachna vigintioctopunctata]|uniref:Uncharacterized protein n=1 Tax=Henosepilachna vigintioctopunctata TaxID=420089 RepID=A0AAW1TR98_9CUCU
MVTGVNNMVQPTATTTGVTSNTPISDNALTAVRKPSHNRRTEVPPYHYTQLFDFGRGNLKVPNNSAALQRSFSPSIAVSAETISHSMGSSRAISLPRPISPSTSVVSEKTEVDLQENQEREEE